MTIWLKQSTAADVVIGPFVDDTDGKTPETGLTISQADCQLTKNAGAVAQKNDSTAASHLGGGHYKVPLNTTDTNTLGRLRLYVNESGALPAWIDFMVVPANVWDSMFGADLLDVSLVQVAGSAVSTSTAQLGVNAVQAGGTAWGSGAITAASIASDAITAAKIATGAIDADAIADNAIDAGAIATGAITAAKFAASAIDAAALAADAGTEIATAVWASGTRTLTVTSDPTAEEIADAVWDEVLSGHLTAGSTGEALSDAGAAGTPPTAAEIADAVWDEAKSGHTAGGSFGEEVQAHALTTDVPAASAIADAVWDEALAGHVGAGSTGEALDNAGGGVSAADIADAVWDEALSGHTTAGSAGKAMSDAQDGDYIAGNAAAATTMKRAYDGIIYGAAATGTLSTTQATTDLTGYANDALIGRTLTVTSGSRIGQQTTITDYASSGGLLTFTALTGALANGDQFFIA